MERLTLERAICRVKIVAKNQRWNSKYTKLSPMNEELNKQHEADYIKDAEEHEQIAEWLEELKSYKDLEEQGLLVRLPCKVGDTMYDIVGKPLRIVEHKVDAFHIDKKGFHLQIINGVLEKKQEAKVYFSREEAKKKLEEMKKND